MSSFTSVNNTVNKKCISLLVSLYFVPFLWGQNKPELPKRVKVGVYYYYPEYSKDPFYIVRNDSVQEEINLNTRDTFYWRIRWQKNSLLYLHYITSTKKLSDDEKTFNNAHSIVTRINRVTSNYYTFSGGLDSVKGIGDIQDTIWFKPRMPKKK